MWHWILINQMSWKQTIGMIALVCLWAGCLHPASALGAPEILDVSFFYRMDADARYLTLRNTWQQEHEGAFSVSEAVPLALQAFQAASLEAPLDAWRQQGDPHPSVFFAKAYVRNPSTVNALLNTKLRVILKAKVGALRVDPQVLMTDYGYLERSSRWETLYQQVVNVPVLTPGEEMLVPVAKFELFRFLRFHPDLWPETLTVEVTLADRGTARAAVGKQNKAELKLVPDHFLLPESYRY